MNLVQLNQKTALIVGGCALSVIVVTGCAWGINAYNKHKESEIPNIPPQEEILEGTETQNTDETLQVDLTDDLVTTDADEDTTLEASEDAIDPTESSTSTVGASSTSSHTPKSSEVIPTPVSTTPTNTSESSVATNVVTNTTAEKTWVVDYEDVWVPNVVTITDEQAWDEPVYTNVTTYITDDGKTFSDKNEMDNYRNYVLTHENKGLSFTTDVTKKQTGTKHHPAKTHEEDHGYWTKVESGGHWENN